MIIRLEHKPAVPCFKGILHPHIWRPHYNPNRHKLPVSYVHCQILDTPIVMPLTYEGKHKKKVTFCAAK